ncbi:hypothetical protein VTL71DRAFT_5248 [Oculimacula yallundae]|uniref:Uncharacterized protein n=1 Tax=Oculimacula yallundae TaxID=86028 RepID=A0ABR4C333_9HELO
MTPAQDQERGRKGVNRLNPRQATGARLIDRAQLLENAPENEYLAYPSTIAIQQETALVGGFLKMVPRDLDCLSVRSIRGLLTRGIYWIELQVFSGTKLSAVDFKCSQSHKNSDLQSSKPLF